MNKYTECFVTEEDIAENYNVSLAEVRAKLANHPDIKIFAYLKTGVDQIFGCASQIDPEFEEAQEEALSRVKLTAENIRSAKGRRGDNKMSVARENIFKCFIYQKYLSTENIKAILSKACADINLSDVFVQETIKRALKWSEGKLLTYSDGSFH